jgi:PGF-CTERM protein
MVLSVLAVGPVAAAPAADITASASTTSVSPGDTVNVTYEITNSGDQDASSAGLQFPTPDNVTATSASGDGSPALNQNSVFYISGIPQGETVSTEVTFEVDSGASDGDYTIDATATVGEDTSTASSTVTVSSDDGDTTDPDDGDQTDPGSGDGDLSEYDREISSGVGYWSGQHLYTDVFSSGDSVILQRSTGDDQWTFETDVALEGTGNGEVVFDSSGYQTGTYRLYDQQDTEIQFDLRSQNFDVTADPTTVQDEGEDALTDVTFDSNRQGYSIIIENSEFTPDELEDIFGVTGDAYDSDDDDEAAADEEESGLEVTSKTDFGVDTTIEANFSGVDADDYTFDFTVVDTEISDDVDVTVNEAPDVNAQFASRSNSVIRGDVAEIPITLAEDATATIGIGTPEAGYHTNVSVSDGSGDGEVTLLWNTFNAGTGNEFDVADDDDSVVDVYSNPNANQIDGDETSVIQNGRYTMNLVNGDHTADFGDQSRTSRAAISINTRETSDLRTWTAPDSADVTELSDVLSGVEDGTITQDSTVAVTEGSDVLVAQLEATGLEGYIDTRAPSSATDKFFAADDISVEGTELNPGRNRAPDSFMLDAQSTTVIPDFDNGTHYLLIDAGAIDEIDASDEFEFEFSLDANEDSVTTYNYGLVAPEDGEFENETATTSASFVEGEVSIDTNNNDRVNVRAASGQTITGSSTFAAGTEVDVEAISNDDAVSPYVIGTDEPAEVDDDGEWSATLDFSDETQNVGTSFEVEANALDASDTATGEIEGQPMVNDLTFNDQQSSGESVIVQNANFSAGGFVAIHLSDDGAPGDVVGASGYLDANTDNRVAIVLDEPISENQELIAMAHEDTNGNEAYDFPDADGPYTDDAGDAVVDAAQISGLSAEATPTPTEQEPTPTPTEQEPTPTETEPEPTETEPEPTETETSGEDGPGFGIVVSVLALLAAALLAARRNE